MAHSHSHSGGGHDHSHSHGSSPDFSSLVDAKNLAKLSQSPGFGVRVHPLISALNAFYARNSGRIDNAWKGLIAALVFQWIASSWTQNAQKRRREDADTERKGGKNLPDRPLKVLLRICFPSMLSVESLLAAAYVAALVFRTSTELRAMNGEAEAVEFILGHITGGNTRTQYDHSHSHSHAHTHSHSHGHGHEGCSQLSTSNKSPIYDLARLLLRNLVFRAVPAILSSALLSFLSRRLYIRVRSRLTQHLSKAYMLGRQNGVPHYYRLKSQIPDPGERIIGDADRFAQGLAEVAGCLLGPAVDFVGFAGAAWEWTRSGKQHNKARNPLYYPSLLVLVLSARYLLPDSPWMQLTSQLRLLESLYFLAHASFAQYAESIALFNPSLPTNELNLLRFREKEWTTFQDRLNWKKASEEAQETFVVEDLWGAMGTAAAGWSVVSSGPKALTNEQHSHVHEHSHSHSSHDCETDHDHEQHVRHEQATALAIASHRAAAFLESKQLLAGAADAAGRLLHAKRELEELDGLGVRVAELAVELDGSVAEGSKEGGKEVAIEFDNVDIVAPVSGNVDGSAEGKRNELLVRGLTFRWEPGMNIVGRDIAGLLCLCRLMSFLCFRQFVARTAPANPPSFASFLESGLQTASLLHLPSTWSRRKFTCCRNLRFWRTSFTPAVFQPELNSKISGLDFPRSLPF